MSTPYLDIHNATVYRGENRVLTQFNLRFFRGESTCILGPNGAGKSTLLKLLTRELYPVVNDGTYVKIDGSETAVIWELRKKIGLVSHDLQAGYDAHVSGRQVVMSGLFGTIGIHGHLEVTDEHQVKTSDAIAQFGLQDLEGRRYWHLSTGQQRKFLLARAMVHQPGILVLDEPTNGLDLKASHELLLQLQALAQSGTTLLLATHHIYEILPEIQRVVLLREGQVMADGDKAQLITSQSLSQLYQTPLTVEQRNGFYQVFPANYE